MTDAPEDDEDSFGMEEKPIPDPLAHLKQPEEPTIPAVDPNLVGKTTAQLMAELESAGVDLSRPSARQGLSQAMKRQLMDDATLQDTATRAARMRSHRATFMRKIDREFGLYECFTVEEAARRTKTRPEVMEKYLIAEAAMVATKIALGAEEGTYMLVNPFD